MLFPTTAVPHCSADFQGQEQSLRRDHDRELGQVRKDHASELDRAREERRRLEEELRTARREAERLESEGKDAAREQERKLREAERNGREAEDKLEELRRKLEDERRGAERANKVTAAPCLCRRRLWRLLPDWTRGRGTGRTPPSASADSTPHMQERDALQKDLEVVQQDLIEARRAAAGSSSDAEVGWTSEPARCFLAKGARPAQVPDWCGLGDGVNGDQVRRLREQLAAAQERLQEQTVEMERRVSRASWGDWLFRAAAHDPLAGVRGPAGAGAAGEDRRPFCSGQGLGPTENRPRRRGAGQPRGGGHNPLPRFSPPLRLGGMPCAASSLAKAPSPLLVRPRSKSSSSSRGGSRWQRRPPTSAAAALLRRRKRPRSATGA